uniref:Uncharacterized protein MANES_14G139700 n=1 Tax=Rhizophora mucronata TaxID=61149 RepID=A0A2P2LVY1_RHIMU
MHPALVTQVNNKRRSYMLCFNHRGFQGENTLLYLQPHSTINCSSLCCLQHIIMKIVPDFSGMRNIVQSSGNSSPFFLDT